MTKRVSNTKGKSRKTPARSLQKESKYSQEECASRARKRKFK